MKRTTTLTLIVGVPGTGKSTLANKIKNQYEYMDRLLTVRETDEYFVDARTGEYHFDPSKLGEYHSLCQKGTEGDLEAGHDVIVCNTNLTKWERAHYFDIARRTSSDVVIIVMKKIFGNIHNIPEDKIEMMKNKFEEISADEFAGIRQVTFLDPEFVQSR